MRRETMPAVQVLHTAHATAIGGRNGHTQSDDGIVSVDLSVPKAMGGPGKPGTTTPEDLFAAGYAACFGSAVEFMGVQMKKKPSSVEVKAAVGIGKSGTGFGLKVDAEKVVAAGHALCPYSNAIKGNVDVSYTVHTS